MRAAGVLVKGDDLPVRRAVINGWAILIQFHDIPSETSPPSPADRIADGAKTGNPFHVAVTLFAERGRRREEYALLRFGMQGVKMGS